VCLSERGGFTIWSGRWDSNPRHSAWEADRFRPKPLDIPVLRGDSGENGVSRWTILIHFRPRKCGHARSRKYGPCRRGSKRSAQTPWKQAVNGDLRTRQPRSTPTRSTGIAIVGLRSLKLPERAPIDGTIRFLASCEDMRLGPFAARGFWPKSRENPDGASGVRGRRFESCRAYQS
jgi:hypothetical protein